MVMRAPVLLLLLSPLSLATWVDICSSDFGAHCCAPGMETREYMFREMPASWQEHQGFCV